MEQKTIMDFIKKCKQDSRILSLQETYDAVAIEDKNCSTFLSKSGLLAQGEGVLLDSKKRYDVITFRDPATTEVKGED